MTPRALLGLAIYNLLVCGVGSSLLWGSRGWRSWNELVRLLGVAYLLAVACLMIVFTLEIVLGIPQSLATAGMTGAALFAAGIALGRIRGCARPIG